MRSRKYTVVYRGEEHTVSALCEEGAYWAILARYGITPRGDVDAIVAGNTMEISLK